MESSKDVSKRDHSRSCPVLEDENQPMNGPKSPRPAITSEYSQSTSSTVDFSPTTPAPEAESATPECDSSSVTADSSGSLRSPSPEHTQSDYRPTDNDVSSTIQRFYATMEDRPLPVIRPLPRRPVLESPSPERAGVSYPTQPLQDIADTDSSCASSDFISCSSSSHTFAEDVDGMLHMPEISRTWPVNVRNLGRHAPAYDIPDRLRAIGDRNPLFCCGDLQIHPRTNPIMPNDLEKIHRPVIYAFVANINPKFEEVADLTEEEGDAINRTIKVNRVGAGIEISSFLFGVLEPEGVVVRILDSAEIMPFNAQGKGSYQSYVCPTHRNMYRIGVYDKKYSYIKKRMSFGDILIDYAFGLVDPDSPRSDAEATQY